MREARVASDRLGLQLDIFKASTESDIDTAFAVFVEHRVNAVVVVSMCYSIAGPINSQPWQLATRCPQCISIVSLPRPVD